MKSRSEQILTRIIREEIMKALEEASVVDMPMKQQNEHGMCACKECVREAMKNLGSGDRLMKLSEKLTGKAKNPAAMAVYLGRKHIAKEGEEFPTYHEPNDAEHPDRSHEHGKHLSRGDEQHHPLDCECKLCQEGGGAEMRKPSDEMQHEFPEDREGMQHEGEMRKPSHELKPEFPEDREGKMNEKAKLGSGARFRSVEKSAAASGARDPSAVAAAAGRKKYGAKKMGQLAHHESKEMKDEFPEDRKGRKHQ